MTDLKTLSELTKANQIWFEIETEASKEIEGVFSEKKSMSLRNFVQEIEQNFELIDN